MKYYIKCFVFSSLISLIFLFIDLFSFSLHTTGSVLKVLFYLAVANFIIWLIMKLITYLILVISVLFLRNVPDFIIFVILFLALFCLTVFVWKLFAFVYAFSLIAIVSAGIANSIFYYWFIFSNDQAWLEGF